MSPRGSLPRLKAVACLENSAFHRIRRASKSWFSRAFGEVGMALSNTLCVLLLRCFVTAAALTARPPGASASMMASRRRRQQADLQQVKLRPPIHLAFDALQLMHLSLHLTITPRVFQGCSDCCSLLPHPRRTTPPLCHGTLLCMLQPLWSHLGLTRLVPLPKGGHEVSDGLALRPERTQVGEERLVLRGQGLGSRHSPVRRPAS